MQKLTGTASLVYGISFCHNVIYAHVLVKILNMVTDFCVTCSCAGGGLPSYLGMIFFSLEADLPYEFSFILFTISFTEERKVSIYNSQREKKCCGIFCIVFSVTSFLFIRGTALLNAVCVCLVQIVKHS